MGEKRGTYNARRLGAELAKEEVIEMPPSGWKNVGELTKELLVSHYFIQSVIEKYRNEHLDWFKIFIASNNKRIEYLHPDLVEEISKEIKAREIAPEGWQTIADTSSLLRLSKKTILNWVAEYRSQNPQWFHNYRGSNNNLAEYLHPDLLDILTQEVKKRGEEAPAGWATKYDIAHSSKVSLTFTESLIEKYREGHPEWFHNYLNRFSRPVEHLHPELVAILTQEIEDRGETAPEGWKNLLQLRKKLDIGARALVPIVEKYREGHPEWFHNYIGESGMISEYFHPDLVATLTQEVKDRGEPAPEGWSNVGAMATSTGVYRGLIVKYAEKYRLEHPDWFRDYLDPANKKVEHLHPDLVTLILSDVERERKISPPGWKNVGGLVKELKVSNNFIVARTDRYRQTNPEWFHDYVIPGKKICEHFHPDLVAIIVQEINNRGEAAPEGWKTLSGLIKEFKAARETLESLVEPYRESNPEWFQNYLDLAKRITEHLHPDLIILLNDKIKEIRKSPPEGWKTVADFKSEVGFSLEYIYSKINEYREKHPNWFNKYFYKKKLVEYCHPDFVAILKKEKEERADPAPAGWLTRKALARNLDVQHAAVLKYSNEYRLSHPEWFCTYLDATSKPAEHYHPDLCVLIIERFQKGGEYAPEGWKTMKGAALTLHVDSKTISKYTRDYRVSHPEWFKDYLTPGNRLYEHLHPDLIKLISNEFEEKINSKEEVEKEKKSRADLEKVVHETVEGKSVDGKQLRALIGIFGASRCVDILFKFRPDFKGLPVEYVKKIIGEYLGDFLAQKGEFKPGEVAIPKEYLSDQTLRDGLYQNIKANCLRYYYEVRKAEVGRDPYDIIYSYIEHILDQFGEHRSVEIDNIVEEVIEYFDAALRDFVKPEKFVDRLSAGREFPDINQKINMKELADQKRLLIADEMGLGKSASVIMAKENMRVKCAVITAPANVIETWQTYLSDDQKKGGYFKPGEAPRVAVVEGGNFKDVKTDDFDYILISHESLKGKQVDELKRIGFDMLVVDEAHKVSNVKGVRTESLVKLSEEIVGDQKYLALLSGTPAQNKVKDLATSLRLLYPEKFEDVSDAELTGMLVYGDIVDLRSLLLPKLQMKELKDSVEMPKFTEQIVEVEMSEAEKEILEVILEDDELTATEKMHALRKMLLDPELLDATPNLESSKIKAASEDLNNAFTKHNRVLMFVNDYVEGVIRGEKTIIPKLNLPADVQVRVVHGKTEERGDIQTEFNTPDGRKILLIVGGQTGDVGVAYTGAEHILTYNGPWTESRDTQQVSRANRPGLKHELNRSSLVTKGTIEEGIQEYRKLKHRAIEKLLRGIPLSELEETILSQPEPTADQDQEVNAELAEYFFSSWNKLMRMFGYIKEIGEEKFSKFLADHANEYADAYTELGNRSYQANANRIAGTLIKRFAEERGLSAPDLRILDLDSGPEMLKRHISEEFSKRVYSMDINLHHFKSHGENRLVGSHLNIPLVDKAFEFVNFALSWHYTKFAPSRGEYERVQVLQEINRVLKPGGRAVLNIIYSLQLKDTDALARAVEPLGFKVVGEYTGETESGNAYNAYTITLEKVSDVEGDVHAVVEKIGVENLKGLKFEKSGKKVKSSRHVVEEFKIGENTIPVEMNAADQLVLAEEKSITSLGRQLRDKYDGVARIPAGEIVRNKFSRILVGKKYILFRKLEHGKGVIIVK